MSPGKRGKASDGGRGSVKKFKPAAGKPLNAIDSGRLVGMPKMKTTATGATAGGVDGGGAGGAGGGMPAFDPLHNEQIKPLQETPKPNLPKNETPNRFWAFVEPYCAPINSEDIKVFSFCWFECFSFTCFLKSLK